MSRKTDSLHVWMMHDSDRRTDLAVASDGFSLVGTHDEFWYFRFEPDSTFYQYLTNVVVEEHRRFNRRYELIQGDTGHGRERFVVPYTHKEDVPWHLVRGDAYLAVQAAADSFADYWESVRDDLTGLMGRWEIQAVGHQMLSPLKKILVSDYWDAQTDSKPLRRWQRSLDTLVLPPIS